jgi:hypothetical protein
MVLSMMCTCLSGALLVLNPMRRFLDFLSFFHILSLFLSSLLRLALSLELLEGNRGSLGERTSIAREHELTTKDYREVGPQPVLI